VSAAPLVSVIVPCHDAEAFVAETLDSVLGQTHPRVETIVVDDASTDGSPGVLARYADRVRVVRMAANGGAARARNRGAALAGGEFLMFLDSDDLLSADAVEGLVEALADGDGGVAGCRWRRLRKVRGRWRPAAPGVPRPDPRDPLRGWLAGRAWYPPCALLWRREAYARAGGWDEALTLNDDGELAMRGFLAGVRLVEASRGEALYREHGTERVSLGTAVFSDRSLRSQLRVLEKVEAGLAARDLSEAYAEPLAAGYAYLAGMAVWQGHPEIGRHCTERAEALAGRRPAARTRPGRLLARLLGTERKERLARALARLGLASRERRRFGVLRARHGAREAGGRDG
jgi:O-antigen biosynthesis protein